MVTTDTDSYIPLIINGTRDAAAIKEMIFTKVWFGLILKETGIYLSSFAFSSRFLMKINNSSLYTGLKLALQQWERSSQTTC